MLGKLKSIIKRKSESFIKFNNSDFLNYDKKNIKVLQGRMISNLNNHIYKNISKLSDVEFQVFSQFGDDGIIQWLIHKIDIPNKTFIEFGVESYIESNTRFLLINNNWQGLVIDGNSNHIESIKKDEISLYHHLFAKCAFITKDNINELLSNLPFDNEIGILSIDIDGNDYYIWKEINVINPIIIISEYNAHFELNPWTIPYKENFVRVHGCDEMNYWGVSLVSLCDLAEEKGYYFIGCNSAGNNAYFIRKDKINDIKPLMPKEGYEFAKFRETFKNNGDRHSYSERLDALKGNQVYNTQKQILENI